jgi:hypothetical protein
MSTQRLALFFSTLTFSVLATAAVPKNISSSEKPECPRSKEFITSYEFLKSQIDWVGTEKKALELAEKVSAGCKGSAARFISTIVLLEKAELENRSIIDQAVSNALANEKRFQAFKVIFQQAYLSQALDLDAFQSLAIAKKLSVDLPFEKENLEQDFRQLVQFCLDSKGLGLSRPQCAQIVTDWISAGSKFQGSVAKGIKELFQFLQDSKSEKVSIGSFVDIATKIAGNGDAGVENFRLAYQYAQSEKGLKMNNKEALQFAIKMSEEPLENPKD